MSDDTIKDVNECLINSIREKELKLKDSEGNEYTVAKLNINNQFKTNQKEAKEMLNQNQTQSCWKKKITPILSNDHSMMLLLDRINVGFSAFVGVHLGHCLKEKDQMMTQLFLENAKGIQIVLHDDCNIIAIPDYITDKLNAMFSSNEKKELLKVFGEKAIEVDAISTIAMSLETSLNAFSHIIKSNPSLGAEVGLSHMIVGDSNIFTAVEKLTEVNKLNGSYGRFNVKKLMEAFFKAQIVLEDRLIIPKSVDYLKLMSNEKGALDGLIFEFFKSSFMHVSSHLKGLSNNPKYVSHDMYQNPFYKAMLESQERQKNIPNPLSQGQQMGIPNPLPQSMCPPQWQQMGFAPNWQQMNIQGMGRIQAPQSQQFGIPNPLPQGAYPNHVPQWQQTGFAPQGQHMGIPNPLTQDPWHNPFKDMSFVFQNPQTQGYQTEIPNPSTQDVDPNSIPQGQQEMRTPNPVFQSQQLGIPNPVPQNPNQNPPQSMYSIPGQQGKQYPEPKNPS